VFIGFVVLLFSGCAANRGVVSLDTPQIGTIAASNGKSIYVNSVSDKRIFEAKPATPNIPSLSPVEINSPAIKSRAVGRKRNSYGVALGDILLKEGRSVEQIVGESVEQAFLENGYSIIKDKKDVTPETMMIDVKINKLWSWMNPGFWALKISCEIETDLIIGKNSSPKVEVISVNASNNFQTGAGSNYISVMKQARQMYIAEVKNRLR